MNSSIYKEKHFSRPRRLAISRLQSSRNCFIIWLCCWALCRSFFYAIHRLHQTCLAKITKFRIVIMIPNKYIIFKSSLSSLSIPPFSKTTWTLTSGCSFFCTKLGISNWFYITTSACLAATDFVGIIYNPPLILM